jgi:hypothetical protein
VSTKELGPLRVLGRQAAAVVSACVLRALPACRLLPAISANGLKSLGSAALEVSTVFSTARVLFHCNSTNSRRFLKHAHGLWAACFQPSFTACNVPNAGVRAVLQIVLACRPNKATTSPGLRPAK